MDDAKLIEKLAPPALLIVSKKILMGITNTWYLFGYYFSSFYCDSSLAAMKKIEKVFVSNASRTAAAAL